MFDHIKTTLIGFMFLTAFLGGIIVYLRILVFFPELYIIFWVVLISWLIGRVWKECRS